MRTCTIHGCTAPLLDLNIGPFLQDSRVSNVEHTLDILIKSRHGNDAFVRKLGRFVTTQFHAVREVCTDLHPKTVVIPFMRKAFRSVIDAVRNGVWTGFQIIRERITETLMSAAASPKSPSTLGRGSPNQPFAPKQIQGTKIMIPDPTTRPPLTGLGNQKMIPKNNSSKLSSLKTQGTNTAPRRRFPAQLGATCL